jgi:hypothetical protein
VQIQIAEAEKETMVIDRSQIVGGIGKVLAAIQ